MWSHRQLRHVWSPMPTGHLPAELMLRFGCASQIRGSIPLYWVQDTNSVSPINPKPAIQLQQYDPHYSATRLHFQVTSRARSSPIQKQPVCPTCTREIQWHLQ
jgi:hypothetical protein